MLQIRLFFEDNGFNETSKNFVIEALNDVNLSIDDYFSSILNTKC